MKKYIIVFILFFYSAIAGAQDNTDNTSIKKVPFTLLNNHIYLEVRVNNSKPLWFLLDTGASDIIDLKRAKELGLVLHSFQKTEGMGNALDDAAITDNVLFEVQNAKFRKEKTAVIALKSVEDCAAKLSVDSTGKVTMHENAIGEAAKYQPLDGVLGYGFFEAFVVEINYEQRFLTLYDPKTYKYEGNGKVIPIDITNNHIFTHASIKPSDTTTITGRFVIDTGSMLAVILNTPFITKHHLLPPPSQTTPLSLCGIGGTSQAQVGITHALIIQDIEINNPLTIFSQATGGVLLSAAYDGNIGNAILRRFKVIFDYANRQMILE